MPSTTATALPKTLHSFEEWATTTVPKKATRKDPSVTGPRVNDRAMKCFRQMYLTEGGTLKINVKCANHPDGPGAPIVYADFYKFDPACDDPINFRGSGLNMWEWYVVDFAKNCYPVLLSKNKVLGHKEGPRPTWSGSRNLLYDTDSNFVLNFMRQMCAYFLDTDAANLPDYHQVMEKYANTHLDNLARETFPEFVAGCVTAWPGGKIVLVAPRPSWTGMPQEEDPRSEEDDEEGEDSEEEDEAEVQTLAEKEPGISLFGIDMPMKLWPKGVGIAGDPGSKKTVLMKFITEAFVSSIPSHNVKHFVIVDIKGDHSQVIATSDYVTPETRAAWDDVHCEILTLGADVGKKATLDPFVGVPKLNALSLDERADLMEFHSAAQELAISILSNTVACDKSGKLRLEDGFSMPTVAKLRSEAQRGLQAKEETVIAKNLVQALVSVLYKIKKTQAPLPHNYDVLLAEIKVATEPKLSEFYGRRNAQPIDTTVVKQEDLTSVAEDIAMRCSLECGLSHIFEPVVPSNSAGKEEIVPLSAEHLFRPPPNGKKMLISVINLAVLGKSQFANSITQLAMATLMRSINAFIASGKLNGSDTNLKAVLMLDEAALVMPNQGEKTCGDAVTTTLCIKNNLMQHRDKGLGHVIALQRVKGVNSEVHGLMTGARFVGQFDGSEGEIDKMMKDFLKASPTEIRESDGRVASNKSNRTGILKQRIKSLKKGDFMVVVGDEKIAQQITLPPQLKRTYHGSSTGWIDPKRHRGNIMQKAIAAYDTTAAAGPSNA